MTLYGGRRTNKTRDFGHHSPALHLLGNKLAHGLAHLVVVGTHKSGVFFAVGAAVEQYHRDALVVGLVDDLIVESLGDDYSTVILAGIQHVLQYGCRKRAEDVSSTEVDPCWSIMRLLPHSGNIKLRKLIAFLLPFFWIEFV